LVALARPTEAQTAFTTALSINPRYAKAHFNLGNLLLERRDLAGALEHFRAVVALDSSDLAARNNLGGVLLELGQPAAAVEHLVFAASAQTDAFEAHFGLGNAYLLLGRHDDAAREFEAVLRLRPDLALARERLRIARSAR
jgi:tetratricopeptide (TPR) repeat protein